MLIYNNLTIVKMYIFQHSMKTLNNNDHIFITKVNSHINIYLYLPS